MLNLALVALLSGSLFAAPDGDCKKERACERDQAPVALEAVTDVRSVTADTYAFGRAADSAPIKLWVEYGRGFTEDAYLPNGTEATVSALTGGTADRISAQRLGVGLQLNVINFSSFKLGVGGQLNVAQDQTELGGTTVAESAFGLQSAKIFGMARGRVVGIHGGYILDLADGPTPTELDVTTDQLDAIFFGADFDYPSERFRLFGGLDYFMPQSGDIESLDATGAVVTSPADPQNNILLFTMGVGLKFSVFELGTAFLMRAQDKTGQINASGSHAGSLVPYLRISPPSLPVSIFVKGGVAREYADYGFPLGGGNDVKAGVPGFTAGLTVGFE